MEAYRVSHKTSGHGYYVLASPPQDAVEVVTLRIADLEGSAAWEAVRETPDYTLPKGVVLDEDGEPVQSMEA